MRFLFLLAAVVLFAGSVRATDLQSGPQPVLQSLFNVKGIVFYSIVYANDAMAKIPQRDLKKNVCSILYDAVQDKTEIVYGCDGVLRKDGHARLSDKGSHNLWQDGYQNEDMLRLTMEMDAVAPTEFSQKTDAYIVNVNFYVERTGQPASNIRQQVYRIVLPYIGDEGLFKKDLYAQIEKTIGDISKRLTLQTSAPIKGGVHLQ